MEKGYYKVKHYNHYQLQIKFYNGKNFEGFKSDNFIHDEIESYELINLEGNSGQLEPLVMPKLPRYTQAKLQTLPEDFETRLHEH